MLKRLFLTILIACLALPAVASSRAASPVEAHHAAASAPCHGSSDGQEQTPVAAPAKHQCIGCVPLVAEIAPVGQAEALHGIAAVGTEPNNLTGTCAPPATPPPRT